MIFIYRKIPALRVLLVGFGQLRLGCFCALPAVIEKQEGQHAKPSTGEQRAYRIKYL